MLDKIGGGAGIRTLGAITLNGFQDRRFRPLSHPTGMRDYTEVSCSRKSYE